MKGRNLSDDEIRAWKRVMRDVTPLRKSVAPDYHEIKDAGPRGAGALKSPRKTPVAPAAPRFTPSAGPDLFGAGDPKQDRHLRRGKLAITASLDLHGLTQDRAFQSLTLFLDSARKAGHRHVLVITGRGRDPDGGVLRRNFHHWVHLPALSQHIIRVSKAAPSHGGDGAFYVFLKRR